eukprot:Hpha_TRINITY_DN7687_c0_g1::TRINITY_DN7687_c0_g1_i1::g.19367::m.19367/K14004/SEC13; protein transport protein SEC13
MVEVLNTGHEAQVQCASFDAFGQYLATCGSDGSVRVFQLREGQQSSIADLREHRGPVWRVAWAPPAFGRVLASASHDRHAIVWAQQQCSDGQVHFVKVHDFAGHDSSVNGVAFAPEFAGLMLATCGSDGKVAVLTHNVSDPATWQTTWVSEVGADGAPTERAHNIGVHAVAFVPAPADADQPLLRLASCGADNLVKLWRWEGERWTREKESPNPTGGEYPDWVRDIAFCSAQGETLLASCSKDKVYVWRQGGPDEAWKQLTEIPLRATVCAVAWQEAEGLLAATTNEGKVHLFLPKRTDKSDEWVQLSVHDAHTGAEAPGQQPAATTRG